MRYPLVDGQGNFGSVDGDSAAAMRYTEARMSKIAAEILADIEKETVNFNPNYDESLSEPSVMPTRVPNLLLNGSEGIAVGMATKIPPHNLSEVVEAVIAVIKKPNMKEEELLKLVPGPDFPTGGFIYGREGIRQAYTTGRGIIQMRARAGIDRIGRGQTERDAIIITEIPYQVNKAVMVERISDSTPGGRACLVAQTAPSAARRAFMPFRGGEFASPCPQKKNATGAPQFCVMLCSCPASF